MTLITAGCARSLTPLQFTERCPGLTEAKYYGSIEGKEAISNGRCEMLVEGRKYRAPMGLGLTGDMMNGAKGVNEWVQVDEGNSYILNDFEWDKCLRHRS